MPDDQNRRKIKIAFAIGTGVVVATVGAVAALWSASGSGASQSEALNAQPIVVAATSGAADLYPGFTEGDLHFTADNPNPYPVTMTSFSVSSVTSSDEVGCPASHLTIDDAGAISTTIAAGASGVPGSIDDVVTLASAAPDGCQGATFTVNLTLSGSQS